jgi:hypothetical protein
MEQPPRRPMAMADGWQCSMVKLFSGFSDILTKSTLTPLPHPLVKKLLLLPVSMAGRFEPRTEMYIRGDRRFIFN